MFLILFLHFSQNKDSAQDCLIVENGHNFYTFRLPTKLEEEVPITTVTSRIRFPRYVQTMSFQKNFGQSRKRKAPLYPGYIRQKSDLIPIRTNKLFVKEKSPVEIDSKTECNSNLVRDEPNFSSFRRPEKEVECFQNDVTETKKIKSCLMRSSSREKRKRVKFQDSIIEATRF